MAGDSDPCVLGRDRVFRCAAQLLIETPSDMQGWEVRRYRRILIRYRGEPFFLVGRTTLDNGLHRYVLDPWPVDYPDPPWTEIVYDREYVKSRDEWEQAVRRRRLTFPFIALLFPIVGLLPSSAQAAFHERYGLHPQTATAVSVRIEQLLFLTSLILLIIDSFTGIFHTWMLWMLIFAVALLGMDAWIRRDALLSEVMNPPGFYEWLFRLLFRNR